MTAVLYSPPEPAPQHFAEDAPGFAILRPYLNDSDWVLVRDADGTYWIAARSFPKVLGVKREAVSWFRLANYEGLYPQDQPALNGVRVLELTK